MTKRHADDLDIHMGAYAQDSDPGAVGAHKLWVDTTGGVPPYPIKKRNPLNTAWEAVGVGPQGAAVASVASPDAAAQGGGYVQADVQSIATLANELKAQLNAALARLRAHGLIAP